MSALVLAMPFIDPKYDTTKKISLFIRRNGKSFDQHYNTNDGCGNLLYTTFRKCLTLSNRQILIDKQKDRNISIGQSRIKRGDLLQDTHYVGTMDELKRFKLTRHRSQVLKSILKYYLTLVAKK